MKAGVKGVIMQHSKRLNMTGWALMLAVSSQQCLAAKQAPIFALNEHTDDSPPSITQAEAQQIVSLACSTDLSLTCFESQIFNEIDYDEELVDVADDDNASIVPSAVGASGKAVKLTSSEVNSVENSQPASAVDVGDAISLVLGAMTMMVASVKLHTTSAEPTEQNNQQNNMLGYSGNGGDTGNGGGGTLKVTDVWLLDNYGSTLKTPGFDETFKTMQQFFTCVNEGGNINEDNGGCDDPKVLSKISDSAINNNTITYHYALQLKYGESLPDVDALKKNLEAFLPNEKYDIWLYPELDKGTGSFTQTAHPVCYLKSSVDKINNLVDIDIQGIIIENEGYKCGVSCDTLGTADDFAKHFKNPTEAEKECIDKENFDEGNIDEEYKVSLIAAFSNLNKINTGIGPYDYILGELYDFYTKDSPQYKEKFPSEDLWQDFYDDPWFFRPFSSNNKNFDNDKAVFVYSADSATLTFNVKDTTASNMLKHFNDALVALPVPENPYDLHVGLWQMTDFLSPDSSPVFPDLSDESDAII